MQSKFIKHFMIIGSGTVINMLLSTITTPIITRLVDPTEYGQFSMFTLYSNIAVMVLCMGFDFALVRYYFDDSSVDYKRALLFRCIVAPVATSILFSVLFITLFAVTSIVFKFQTSVLIMLCLFSIIQIICRFSQLIVRLEYKTKLYSALSITQKAVYVILAILLLSLSKMNHLTILVAATTVAAAICMIVSIIAQHDVWKFSCKNILDKKINQKSLFKYAYPYVFSSGIAVLFESMDKLSLDYFSTDSEVGIYAAATTLVNIFAIIQSTFNTLWAPMAVEHYSQDENDTSFHQRGNLGMTVIMYFFGISLILVKDMFAVLLGGEYRAAALILPFLIFHPILYTVSETVNGLILKKKSKLQIVVVSVACAVNLIGNTILVPRFGGQGAAISTGISFIVMYLMRVMLSNRYFYVDLKMRKFYIITALVSGYALYNTFFRFNIGSVIGYLICLVALIILYRDTIRWGISYLLNSTSPIINKLKKKN